MPGGAADEREPQFEHKNPRFLRPTSYNAVASPVHGGFGFAARGNDLFSFGLKALPEYGAALRSRPEQMGSALQTGFTQ